MKDTRICGRIGQRMAAVFLALALLLPYFSVHAEALGTDKQEWFYTQLSREGKAIYEAVLSAAQNQQAQVNIGISPSDQTVYAKVINALSYEQPELFWSTGWTFQTQSAKSVVARPITPKIYTASKSAGTSKTTKSSSSSSSTPEVKSPLKLEQIQEDMDGIRSIAAQIVASAGSTPYDKLVYFNQWLIDNVVYDEAAAKKMDNDKYAASFTAVGALSKGKALCQGYALAMKYLCDLADIPCIFVPGKAVSPGSSKAIAHAWNYVQLEGEWYLLDATWNDPVIVETVGQAPVLNDYSTMYFLRGSQSTINGKSIASFYRPDSSEFYLPVLSKTDYLPSGADSNGTTSNVSLSNIVNTALIKAVNKAKSASMLNAVAQPVIENTTVLTPAEFRELRALNHNAGKDNGISCTTTLLLDTVENGMTKGRLYVPLAGTEKLKNNIYTQVKPAESDILKRLRDAFDTPLTAVRFEQKGPFGMTVRAGVTVDVSDFDQSNLFFYSYNNTDGTYALMTVPKYSVDKNGYIYFDTSRGDYVIISDGPLSEA